MNRIEFVISPKRKAGFRLCFTGPGAWSEVSPHQAIGIIRLQAGVRQAPQLLFPLLTLLFGMKARHLRWLFDERFLRAQGVSETEMPILLENGQILLDSLHWTGNTSPGMRFLVPSFRRFDFRFGSIGVLLRRLGSRQRYHSPEEGLSDLKFSEFMLADKAYQDRDFVRLAALLYVPTAGKRPAIDQKAVAARIRRFRELEPALVQLIALQYESCLEYLQRCFPFVFPKREPGDAVTKPKGNWLDVAINMAKLDATKVGAIEELNLYLALKVLNEQIRQAEELEEHLDNLKRK